MKQLQLLFILLAFPLAVFAQIDRPEQANWIFGFHAGIDFSSGAPVAVTGSQISAIQGSAVISDRDGNLLFYSDGATIWNSSHVPMSNGTGLVGGLSSQPALIVPKPCSDSYYVFTTTTAYGDHRLRYSEVDLSLDGGLGDVTSVKNVALADSIGQKITAIRPAGETDIWVISRQTSSNRFLSWRVTAGGIDPFPVVSYAGAVIDSLGMGNLEASAQGDKLVSMNSHVDGENFTADLLRFDPYNGTVSTICAIPLPFTHPYGAEFSQSGSRLYISSWQHNPIWQYDLTLPDTSAVIASGVPVSPVPIDHQYGALQMAPDGRIYFPFMEQPYLGCIENPDALGAACGFVENAFQLQEAIGYIGLPNFMQGDAYKPCPGKIPNVITPNGDGTNDFFELNHVAAGEGSLTIFNRWGTPVFTADAYHNDWSGNDLSDGVYFYLYRYANGDQFSGHVEIIR